MKVLKLVWLRLTFFSCLWTHCVLVFLVFRSWSVMARTGHLRIMLLIIMAFMTDNLIEWFAISAKHREGWSLLCTWRPQQVAMRASARLKRSWQRIIGRTWFKGFLFIVEERRSFHTECCGDPRNKIVHTEFLCWVIRNLIVVGWCNSETPVFGEWSQLFWGRIIYATAGDLVRCR